MERKLLYLHFPCQIVVCDKNHEGLKSGKYPREHLYSLTYAKKAVNEMQKNYDTAKRLWGEQEN